MHPVQQLYSLGLLLKAAHQAVEAVAGNESQPGLFQLYAFAFHNLHEHGNAHHVGRISVQCALQIVVEDEFRGNAQDLRHRLVHFFQEVQQRAIALVDFTIIRFCVVQCLRQDKVKDALLLILKQRFKRVLHAVKVVVEQAQGFGKITAGECR